MSHWEDAEDNITHGTINAYRYHKCRCTKCREANANIFQRDKNRRKAKTQNPNDPRHGTPSFYNNHGCRCEPCTTAWKATCKAYRKNGTTT